MLAIDVATLLLVGGIVVLCVTTAITALTLPSFSPQWRRRPRSTTIVLPASSRSPIVTPPAHSVLALPPAPGRTTATPDDRHRVDDVDTAWALIERLLEHDPGRLVDVLHSWIAEDLPDPTDDTPKTRTRS